MSIRDEARREYVRWAVGLSVGSIGDRLSAAWDAGAAWERDREPTEAEVEALVDDIIYWDDTTATDGPCDGTWDSLAAHLTRRGWTRTARRDEETDR